MRKKQSPDNELLVALDEIAYRRKVEEKKMSRRFSFIDARVRSLWANFMETRVMTREEFIETVSDTIHEPPDVVREAVDRMYPEEKDVL